MIPLPFTTEALERTLQRYRAAKAAGQAHVAQLERARYRLAAGDLGGEPFGDEKPLAIAARDPELAAPHAAHAFLASFCTPFGADVLFPLRLGLTVIGFATAGDFQRPAPGEPRAVEMRQWLVIHRPEQTLVLSDRATNPSLVVPRACARLAGASDPRFDESPPLGALIAAPPAGTHAVDPGGAAVVELHEGDVLVSCYAAFVFGLACEPLTGP